MLSGSELASAIRSAIELKRQQPGHSTYGPTALARDLAITQPSASELLTTGRLAKERYLKLVAVFADVVGPDHWGLPYNRQEMRLLHNLRELPTAVQSDLSARLEQLADEYRAKNAGSLETLLPSPTSGKGRKAA